MRNAPDIDSAWLFMADIVYYNMQYIKGVFPSFFQQRKRSRE